MDETHEAAVFENCEVSNIQIRISGNTQYIGTLLGGGMADEDTGTRQSVIVRNCNTENVTITNASGEKISDDNSMVGLEEYAVIE